MAGQRVPGDLSADRAGRGIEDGTQARVAMPRPGSVGADAGAGSPHGRPGASVANWLSLQEIACLRALFPDMDRQTQRYLETASVDGNCFTSLTGIRFIPEDWSDAFGHCWIACQGTRRCGVGATAFYGTAYEVLREEAHRRGLWEHNSFPQDLFNQRRGRELALCGSDTDCFELAYRAVVDRTLSFHGHNTASDSARPRVYLCSPATIDGRVHPQGWAFVPIRMLERY